MYSRNKLRQCAAHGIQKMVGNFSCISRWFIQGHKLWGHQSLCSNMEISPHWREYQKNTLSWHKPSLLPYASPHSMLTWSEGLWPWCQMFHANRNLKVKNTGFILHFYNSSCQLETTASVGKIALQPTVVLYCEWGEYCSQQQPKDRQQLPIVLILLDGDALWEGCI